MKTRSPEEKPPTASIPLTYGSEDSQDDVLPEFQQEVLDDAGEKSKTEPRARTMNMTQITKKSSEPTEGQSTS